LIVTSTDGFASVFSFAWQGVQCPEAEEVLVEADREGQPAEAERPSRLEGAQREGQVTDAQSSSSQVERHSEATQSCLSPDNNSFHFSPVVNTNDQNLQPSSNTNNPIDDLTTMSNTAPPTKKRITPTLVSTLQ
jgi:hypothetical protein